MVAEDLWGEALGLLAEDEVVARLESGVEEGALGGGGEAPAACGGVGGEIGRERGVATGIEAGPIVEAGATAGFLGSVESEGFNEVERGAEGDAGATDVPRVVGDLGLDEDDAQPGQRWPSR